ncbi:ring-opening amidohydrolase [Leptolyngbya sp. GB1-A1]|uniref:cyanuric acid amidohydrolase n=1 Tax=Leptolyngbya sp. GB1-A1 TaxID=2933908 RepID=UPI003299499C
MKTPMKVGVYKIPQSSPDDLAGLQKLIEDEVNPATIVAIMGKTEGNGCVNDFTRGFAVQTLKTFLSQQIGDGEGKMAEKTAEEIIYVMSGGTEGVLSPHLTIFTQEQVEPDTPHRWGLVLGVSRTRDFLPQEVGTVAMVKEVADAVQQAIDSAGLNKADVHFVQIKCPLVTAAQREQSGQAGSSYQSMAYSRGASALGVAVALGEVDLAQLSDADICSNYSLYSSIASTSAGVELQNCEIIVMGNASHSASEFVIGHSVMAHALDQDAVRRAIEQTGQPIDRIVNIFAKAEADPAGAILGRRHTMLDDSDINHTRMARAVVGAVVASVVQDPMVYVSGGSEHQGLPGGGPVAAIVRVDG